jgi:AraC family transcriptional regulator, regulatory protein of adaptative response / methylated-DNA-[protein]-cysteine methyltransferase
MQMRTSRKNGSAAAAAIEAAVWENAAVATRQDPRWARVLARDASADGEFYYSVKTTGVYCRPSCASRRAKLENVLFHDSQEQARRAGLRPCKRCRPEQLRRPSRDSEIRHAVGESSLGSVLVAESSGGICAILLGDDPDEVMRELRTRFPVADLRASDSELAEVVARVVELIERPQTRVDLPLDLRGTAFQRRVWQALRRIPPGATSSYSDVAARIGAPKAVRAVAQACAANSLAVAIPCHRVVRRDGSLSGYRWGEERKRTLLAREARA